MNGGPISRGVRNGFTASSKTEDDRGERQRADNHRADIVHDAAGAAADVLETNRKRKSDADLQRDLGHAARNVVDIAVADVVTDFQDREQNGEQNCRAIGHPCRHIVRAFAQQVARRPERQRGNPVAVKEPVEDRRRSNVAADDTRLPADPQDDDDDNDSDEPAQRGQRPFALDIGDARRHQRERNRQPALVERKREGEGERGDGAGSVDRLR